MGLVRWAKSAYLKRAIRREARHQFNALPREEQMQVLKSKEQWTNVLATIAAILATVNAQEIAAWFASTADAIQSGELQVIIGAAVAAIIGISNFFGRLNRKKEVEEAARVAVKEAEAQRIAALSKRLGR